MPKILLNEADAAKSGDDLFDRRPRELDAGSGEFDESGSNAGGGEHHPKEDIGLRSLEGVVEGGDATERLAGGDCIVAGWFLVVVWVAMLAPPMASSCEMAEGWFRRILVPNDLDDRRLGFG